MMRNLLYCLCLMAALISCNDNRPVAAADGPPPIYPDYNEVTIPVNVAPLNFLVRGDVKGVWVLVDGQTLSKRSDNKAIFDQKQWHRLLNQYRGNQIPVEIRTLNDNCWHAYSTTWFVAPDSIDPYLTYRLIEPDYEVYHNISLHERCIENFDERPISTHRLVGDRCMNCHTFANQDPSHSMMYVRGPGGGAILNDNGSLSKLDIKADGMVSGSVYFAFSPSGRFITFSSNVIIPAFHSQAAQRMEVYDSASDIYVADLQSSRIMGSPLVADTTMLETFPTFSPDGKYIYFCRSPLVQLPENVHDLQYSLCRIAFDEATGTMGQQIETVVNASDASTGKNSVSHPRLSPDGRYLLYTVADYGTFPIWHREADLRMMDLGTGRIDSLNCVNSDKSDTYHSWSSNSRWFVFASKRGDGMYGKPYFCYIDSKGKAHKPFVLPQKNPEFYNYCLKSFNAPELGRGPVPFDAHDVAATMATEAVKFSH